MQRPGAWHKGKWTPMQRTAYLAALLTLVLAGTAEARQFTVYVPPNQPVTWRSPGTMKAKDIARLDEFAVNGKLFDGTFQSAGRCCLWLYNRGVTGYQSTPVQGRGHLRYRFTSSRTRTVRVTVRYTVKHH